jgi:serine/threonine-protein phosphatase 6 regulatory subunit 3
MVQVEVVLDKESFTLENLLDEDDLIQEVKSMNGRLVS